MIYIVCQLYQGSLCPSPGDGGMTENYEMGHTSLTFVDLSSTGEVIRKATAVNNSLIYKETVIIEEFLCDKESTSINPNSLR